MSHSDSSQFRLHVLGAPDLRAPDGRRVTSVLSQTKRLGLLTYLALAEGPVSRATLVALFWPESDEARARNALSQAVFYLRRSLAQHVVQSVEGDRLWVPPEHLWCDARTRLAGNSAARREELGIGGHDGAGDSDLDAGDTGAGELLEGWNADDSQTLQEWLDAQRRRLREPEREGAAPALATGAVGARGLPSHSPPGPPAARQAHRHASLAGVTAFAVLASGLIAVALTDGGGSARAAAPVGDLVVLLPQVAASVGAPALEAQMIHAELLANLPRIRGLRIVSAVYAESPQDIRRQLTALGIAPSQEPRWILGVTVRVASDEARVVGLLYRSPAFDLAGRESFGVDYGSAEAALLAAPQEIARHISSMVGEVLAQEGVGRR